MVIIGKQYDKEGAISKFLKSLVEARLAQVYLCGDYDGKNRSAGWSTGVLFYLYCIHSGRASLPKQRTARPMLG